MTPVLPGATIGLLGGGQLGRMFAIAARKLGYRVHTFEPTPDSPTGQISDREFNFPYTDIGALVEFARGLAVVTYEFENIPIETLDELGKHVALRPGREILHVTQNRRREKEFLARHGFPVAPFRVVTDAGRLRAAVAELGTPCVLKTADFGYDGKGQQKITAAGEEEAVWRRHGAAVGVVEQWVDFEAEVSVIVARGADGQTEFFPMAWNDHARHILNTTTVPAPFPEAVHRRAGEVAAGLAEQLGLVGVLAVEMFLTRRGELVVNELAPRPHNSGHFSFDACVTSQFEQQLRAVCGLPLGSTRLLAPARMRNLLGDLWERGAPPPWQELLRFPNLKLHLYGKSEARPGRKMGHYTVIGGTPDEVLRADEAAWNVLRPGMP